MVGGLDQLRQKLNTRFSEADKPALARRLICVPIIAAVLIAGCDRTPPKGTADSAVTSAEQASYVDSILPMDEAIRRFREGLPEVERLTGGARSREELVTAFIRAVQSGDTTALRGMLVSRAEYAYLYFPSSIYMNKPYELAPGLAWFMNMQNSEKGITRVMRRLGGQDLGFDGYECTDEVTEGANTFWRSCTVSYRDPERKSRVARRLFGAIIERGGQHKFLSYANDF